MTPDQVNYIFYAVWLFIAIVFVLHGYELYIIAQIKKRGIAAQGKIIRKFKRTSKNTRIYYFEVEFSTGLRTVISSYKVPAKAWEDAKENTAIPVIYLSEKPKKCHHPELVAETWNMLALKGAFFTVVLALIITSTIYQHMDPEGTWLKSITQKFNSEE